LSGSIKIPPSSQHEKENRPKEVYQQNDGQPGPFAEIPHAFLIDLPNTKPFQRDFQYNVRDENQEVLPQKTFHFLLLLRFVVSSIPVPVVI
jgi:hypothetical protein